MAERILHLDENLPRRLAAELEARGRPAAPTGSCRTRRRPTPGSSARSTATWSS